METKARIFVLLLTIICSSSYLQGQEGAGSDLLPTPTTTLNCSDVLTYIDDAVLRVDRANPRLLVIVRAKNIKEARIAATRAKYLKNYFRGRFPFVVDVLGDIAADRSNVLDLYLNGNLLYSLPIKRRETMEWSHC